MNCPICHSEIEKQPIAELHDAFYHANDGQLYYYFCHQCEAVFHNEPITEEYYREQYRTDLQGGNGQATYKAVELQQKRAASLQPFLKMIVRDFAPKTALDFGASAGCLVKAMNDMGIKAQGIEIDEIYKSHALKEYGYKFTSLEENIDAGINLVTIMHTLEHLLDPVKTLSTLRAKASDKAVMLCEVPNFATSPLAMSYPHRFAYTEWSLYNVLISSGWYPIWIIPFWGIHRNYWYATNLLALAITLPVSKFEYTMQSARLGQAAARKE
jgi:2-polyprenyl-3-methyl-5-hydroxy-6-metoxy-1,4-benzoquinol methylase